MFDSSEGEYAYSIKNTSSQEVTTMLTQITIEKLKKLEIILEVSLVEFLPSVANYTLPTSCGSADEFKDRMSTVQLCAGCTKTTVNPIDIINKSLEKAKDMWTLLDETDKRYIFTTLREIVREEEMVAKFFLGNCVKLLDSISYTQKVLGR